MRGCRVFAYDDGMAKASRPKKGDKVWIDGFDFAFVVEIANADGLMLEYPKHKRRKLPSLYRHAQYSEVTRHEPQDKDPA